MNCLSCNTTLINIDGYWCGSCGQTSIAKDYYKFNLDYTDAHDYGIVANRADNVTFMEKVYNRQIVIETVRFDFFVPPDINNFPDFADKLLDKLLKLKAFL